MGKATGLYQSLAADPLLKGYKPDAILIDENDDIYLSIKDAIHITKLSPERLRGLVSENRLDAIRPGGHDLFLSLKSINKYLTEGRKPPGRPKKKKPQ